ncbi:hypothetical protein D9M68_692330 [compost metagenome]
MTKIKFMKITLSLIIAVLLTSCGNSSNEKISSEQQTPIGETEIKQKGTLINFSNEDVARFAISSIIGQPSKTIKVKTENGLYIVSYIRNSDSKKFDYKIKIDEEKILWANLDGRWRDTEYDEKISFEENDQTIKIIQTFSDNSVDIKEFKKGE